MKINYIGKKTAVRDSFKKYTEKRLKKLDKFFNDDPVVTVIVTNNNEDETVEITIKSHGLFFRAEKTTIDRIASLDIVVDMLSKQIVKNKKRLLKQVKVPVNFQELEEEEIAVPETSELVKKKKFTVATMGVEEAILQMNLLNHHFFLFRNSKTDTLNVVYRREDGNYGLLEPLED